MRVPGSDLLVIVGPTGVGKTALGVDVAGRLGGEVVSADAFAVYRGMNIGTAKPTMEERRGVRHHLLDVASPCRRYSAGEFVRDADDAIADISGRGGTPIVVGGTFFYVRALLWGLFPEPPKDPELRDELEAAWRRDPDALRRELAAVDPEAAASIARGDRQRILRALEVCRAAGEPMTRLWRRHVPDRPRHPFRMVGIDIPRPDLRDRISQRVRNMFSRGLVDEVRSLLAEGVPANAHALKAIGYRECLKVLSGEWVEQEALEQAEIATRRFAKRQLTWLRAERELVWLSGHAASLAERVVEIAEGSSGSR